MSQDDPQQPDRANPPRISRDTLLLLGALAFLILAVALTFLFTPGGENAGEVAEGTATVGPDLTAGTAVAGGYPTPGGPYPGTEASPAATPGDPAGGGLTSTPPEGYPGPGGAGDGIAAQTATALALNPDDEFGTPGQEPTLPGDDPFAQPTADPNAFPTVDPGFPTTEDPGAYPAPVGDPNAVPTFNPTRVEATAAPPPPPPTAQAFPTTAPAFPPTAQTFPTEAPEPTDDTVFEPPPATATSDPAAPTAQPGRATVVIPGLPALPGVPAAPGVPGAPAQPAADVLRGNVRWAASQSPIILRRDVQLAPGAELVVEPGVEVRLDPGVSIYVDGGRLIAPGLPDRPVRFVGNTGARWSGIYGLPNSYIALENAEISGGGVGGTVMAVERGELVMRASRVRDNGGAILLTDTKLELRDSEIAGNDMPYGAALDASYSRGNIVVMRGNRIGGNILSDGAPMVRFANQSTFDTLNLEISGNLVRGGAPNLQLSTNGPLRGTVDCNALVGENLGLGLRTQTPQVGPNGSYTMDLRVSNNFIDEHIPPVIPVYLRYGLGRGATSEIAVDMRDNWWGDPSGPYEPDQNPEGRGDSVGANITFAPWLTAPPPCAPRG